MDARRGGKTLLHVARAKAAQRAGKKVIWATLDQAETARMLARHGALSEIIGEHYVRAHFRKDADK